LLYGKEDTIFVSKKKMFSGSASTNDSFKINDNQKDTTSKKGKLPGTRIISFDGLLVQLRSTLVDAKKCSDRV